MTIKTKHIVEFDNNGNIISVGFVQSGTAGELKKAWRWDKPSQAIDEEE